MRIKFEITDIPKAEQLKYPTAYLEGVLTILINDVLFFNQSGILLIEFAIFINKWLYSIRKGKNIGLSFDTMDNDEPILSLEYVGNELYRIHSIWQESEILESLSIENLIVEFKLYLKNLENELKFKTGIELKKILKDAQ